MKYSGLYNLLRALTEKRNMHISVHDVSGVLRYDELKLPQKYKIHSRPFCDTAKSTAKGFRPLYAVQGKGEPARRRK